MSLALGYPLALFLFLLLPLVFFIPRARALRLWLRRRNQRISLALRCLIITCLVLTIADIRLVTASDRLAVVFLVDGSDSMGATTKGQALQFVQQALAQMKDSQLAGVVVFGQHALVEKAVDDQRTVPNLKGEPGGSYTNLAEAVRLGVAMLPADSQRRLVLLTDGNQNLDDVRSAAQVAATKGVQIDVLPLLAQGGPEVSVGAVNVSNNIRQGEEFDLSITVDSNYAGNGKLQIMQDGKVVAEQPVSFVEGFNQYHQSVKAENPGMVGYTARIVADKDTLGQNNAANALVFVKDKPRALLIEGHPDQNEAANLSEALKAAGVDVTVLPPNQFPTSTTLLTYDSVILDDVAASDLAKTDLDTLSIYVHDLGRGLVVVGGEESYGLGGYFRTPLEDMLPVSLQLPSRLEIPRIGLVLVVDRSGSMSEGYAAPSSYSRGVAKMEIAKDAAYLAATQLSNNDLLGVVTFDTTAQWTVKVGPLGTASDLQTIISRIQPGGGTSIYNGLALGIEGLKTAKAQVKHIILLTDGQDRDNNQFGPMITDAQRANITVSTVGLGWDVNQTFLRSLATQGGGQYYFADDPNNLPKIFLKESRIAARSYIVEEPFAPSQTSPSPILKGIAEVPPLLGYVATKPKPTATTVLVSPRNDPILAHWQYGLGRVVAWTSDAKARWSTNWLSWDGFGKFWSQAVRWTVPENEVGGLEVRTSTVGDQVLVQADAISADQRYLNGLNTTVTVVPVAVNGTTKNIVLQQTGPGHYEGYFTPDNNDGYTLTVQANSSSTPAQSNPALSGSDVKLTRTLGIAPSYSPEYKQLGLNNLLLQDIANLTQGQILSQQNPQDVFRPGRKTVDSQRELWPWLLALAILLFPLDIAVRLLNPSFRRRKRRIPQTTQ